MKMRVESVSSWMDLTNAAGARWKTLLKTGSRDLQATSGQPQAPRQQGPAVTATPAGPRHGCGMRPCRRSRRRGSSGYGAASTGRNPADRPSTRPGWRE